MLDIDICKDLAARCGGAALIGICGEGAGELAERLNSEGAEGIKFKEGAEECSACIFIYAEGADIKSIAHGKPFVIISYGGTEGIDKIYGCACITLGEWDTQSLNGVLRALLYEFPVRNIYVDIPEWMQVMPQENSAIAELLDMVRKVSSSVFAMKEISALDSLTSGAKYWSEQVGISAELGCGAVTVTAYAKDGIFFDMLSEIAGDKIEGEYSLMRYVRSAAEARRGYFKVRDALECARVNGYGIVQPVNEDMSYEQPQLVRQGNNVGIKLRASAPSYHIIRVDVTGEVSPIMGEAVQSESIVRGMMSGFESNPEATWDTDVFGKSLRSMVQEGLSSKVSLIQEETRGKLRKALTRMVNEGKGGVICIIL